MRSANRLLLGLLAILRFRRAEANLDDASCESDHSNERQRVRRSLRPLDSWWLDVKLGVRMLVKYPGLALVAVFGIAVGVAIAAGGFSVIYGTYLARSLPFEEGDRIVSIQIWDSVANKPERRILHDYRVWREELKSVQQIGAFTTITPTLIAVGAQPESVRVAAISAAGFHVPRVPPLIGRHLSEDDEREGAPAVIVIGETVWRNRFGGNAAILGRTIQLGVQPYSIVGVMPQGFAFPVNHRFWLPLRAGSLQNEPLTGPELIVFGRLAPGATLESAQAELTTIGRRRALELPKIYAQLQPQVIPYPRPFLGINDANDVAGLHVMNGIAATLLVLVCLNVAILVYTRTAMRQAEISVRTALGASRGRIVAQLFIEALILSIAGALAGIAIATLALRQLGTATQHIADELPFWLSFELSNQAVLYAGGLSVLAATIVGIVPALRATRRSVQTGSRISGVDGAGVRLGGTWTMLVVAQVGFAVALLPAAVFNAWDNLHAEMIDPGFAAKEFLTAQLGINEAQETRPISGGTREFDPRYAGHQLELMRRLEAEPRVSSATFAVNVPGDESPAWIEAEGPSDHHKVRLNRVDVNFFRTLAIPILAGRGFESADVAPAGTDPGGSPEGGPIVVNESFAQRVYGGDAVGRRVRYAAGSRDQNAESGKWYEIVGIVKDFPAGISPGMRDSELRLYQAIAVGQIEPANIVLRIRGGAPSTFARRLSEVTAAVHPDLYLRNILGMEEALRKEQWIRRLEAAVFLAISLSVLMLSSAGIYALMSFTVSQRRKEVGIRMALGADRTRIVASIFSRAFGQLAVGAGLGIVSAAMLDKTSGDDLMRGNAVVVLSGVALFMVAVGFLAALGPTRRCLRIQPTEALKEL